jgi:hypothetical protein
MTPAQKRQMDQLVQYHAQQITQLLGHTGIRELTIHISDGLTEQLPGGPGATMPVLINSLPKSGSMYLYNHIAKQFQLPQERVADNFFPDDLIVRDYIRDFANKPCVAQAHLPARQLNRVLLKNHLRKIMVHVRDPRQATLSWVHHVRKLKGEGRRLELSFIDPALPDDYFQRDLAEQTDYQIDVHLPMLVDWIEGWLDAEADPDFTVQILFTQFRDMRNDPARFFSEIAAFFGLPQSQLDADAEQPKGDADHYRKGEVDEWRRVFSPEQIARANAVMTPRICDRFDWPLDTRDQAAA